MDPKQTARLFLAPSAPASAAVRLPGRAAFPSPDEHLVTPELTRDEMIRGRRVIAMPANPPHADRQLRLGYVIGAHVKPGFVGSAELLTRVSEGSDFATDVCVRKEGDDPATGARYLEELSFEVVNEQSARDIREKAEDLSARGVRRVIAVFVKTGKVCEWSRGKGAWDDLDLDATLEDPCLSRPLRVRALLDAAEADDAVARALADKHNPVIEALKAQSQSAGRREGRDEGRKEGRDEGLSEGKAAAILAVLAARGIAVQEETRARILGCREGDVLDRWIVGAATASSAEDVVAR
jgi:hypothetical protein